MAEIWCVNGSKVSLPYLYATECWSDIRSSDRDLTLHLWASFCVLFTLPSPQSKYLWCSVIILKDKLLYYYAKGNSIGIVLESNVMFDACVYCKLQAVVIGYTVMRYCLFTLVVPYPSAKRSVIPTLERYLRRSTRDNPSLSLIPTTHSVSSKLFIMARTDFPTNSPRQEHMPPPPKRRFRLKSLNPLRLIRRLIR